MMKDAWKRACAIAASAAMAVAALAAGATTANALTPVSGDTTFTFQATKAEQLNDHKLDAYKIGDYVAYTANQTTVYGVQTTSTKTSYVEDALKSISGVTVPEGADPLAWAVQEKLLEDHTNEVGSGSGKTELDNVRVFANALAKSLSSSVSADRQVTLAASGSDSSYTATFTVTSPGVYLFLDITDFNADADTASIPMLVYSGTITDGAVTNPTSGKTIDIKNEVTTVDKTVDGGVPGIGDTKTYTITSTVPDWIGKDLTSPQTKFVFTDTPTKGQTVRFQTLAVKVGTNTLTKDTDYKVTRPSGDGDEWPATGTDSFTVDLTDYMKNHATDSENETNRIGQKVTITYSVTINKDALTNVITNAVDVDNNGNIAHDSADASDGIVVNPAELAFTKVDAGNKPLAGAHFSLKKGDTTVYVEKLDDGSYAVSEKQTADDLNTADLVSGTDGVIKVAGLGTGGAKSAVYTLTETSAPADYMQMSPSFTATVSMTGTGNTKTAQVTYADNATSDPFELVTISDATGSQKVTVKNVKNITQLPLTGAAGTALFTVMGLLIAGAAVTLYMKSRKLRDGMRV